MSKSKEIINRIRELVEDMPDGKNPYIIAVVHINTDEACPSFIKSGGNPEDLSKLSEVLYKQVDSLRNRFIVQSLFTDAMNHFMNVLKPAQKDILFQAMEAHADEIMDKILSSLGDKLSYDLGQSDNDQDKNNTKRDSSSKDDLDNYLKDIFN